MERKKQATKGVMSLALQQKLVEGTRRALRQAGRSKDFTILSGRFERKLESISNRTIATKTTETHSVADGVLRLFSLNRTIATPKKPAV